MESGQQSAGGRDKQKILLAVLVAAIVLSVGAIGYVMYSERNVSSITSSRAIVAGDTVILNYIGMLPDGRVFDTSLASVANNNALYPKSLTFTLKSNDSYGPFTMIAGKYGDGGTIKGFAMGVIGLHVNETKLIEVPPGEGYSVDPTMIATVKLVQDIPATETFTVSQFKSAFGTDPILMRTYTHFFWGWDVLVVDNTSGLVTLRYQPTVGEIVYPYGNPNSASNPLGWPVVVEAFDPSGFGGAGKVTIRHELTVADVYNIKGVDVDGKQFVVTAFDATNGTFEIDKIDTQTGYNGELAGRTLFFEVTIVKINPSQK
jgi:FKBP-type peptidyl-prolyl cis-trans isomerase 2